MKKSILCLGMIAMMISMGNRSMAQEQPVTNKWFIQVTTEYQSAFFSKDFKSFMDQHAANIGDLMGVNTLGWAVGMPIPSTDNFKIVGEYFTSIGTDLTMETGDFSLRYVWRDKSGRDAMSFDIGGGLHRYCFEYHDATTTNNVTMEDLNSMLNYSMNSFDITQRLWNVHVGVICEFQFSKRIVASVGLRYRLLMGGKTMIEDLHKTIDAFPQISHHNLGAQIGLTYYFDRL